MRPTIALASLVLCLAAAVATLATWRPVTFEPCVLLFLFLASAFCRLGDLLSERA